MPYPQQPLAPSIKWHTLFLGPQSSSQSILLFLVSEIPSVVETAGFACSHGLLAQGHQATVHDRYLKAWYQQVRWASTRTTCFCVQHSRICQCTSLRHVCPESFFCSRNTWKDNGSLFVCAFQEHADYSLWAAKYTTASNTWVFACWSFLS